MRLVLLKVPSWWKIRTNRRTVTDGGYSGGMTAKCHEGTWVGFWDRKGGDNWLKPAFYLIVLEWYSFFGFPNIPLLNKMLTWGEARWKFYKSSLFYLWAFSVYLKCYQNTKLKKPVFWDFQYPLMFICVKWVLPSYVYVQRYAWKQAVSLLYHSV